MEFLISNRLFNCICEIVNLLYLCAALSFVFTKVKGSNTVSAPIAATAIDIVQMKGKIYHTVFWLNNFRSASS